MTQLDNATRAPHRVQSASCAPTHPTTAFSPDFLIPHLLSESDFLLSHHSSLLSTVSPVLLPYVYLLAHYVSDIVCLSSFAFPQLHPHLISHLYFLAYSALQTPCNKTCVFSFRVYLCFKYPTKCSITLNTLWPDRPIVLSDYRISHFIKTG